LIKVVNIDINNGYYGISCSL